MSFLLAVTVASIGTLLFQCHPINAAWDFAAKAAPGAKCFPEKLFRDLGLFNGCKLPFLWSEDMIAHTKTSDKLIYRLCVRLSTHTDNSIFTNEYANKNLTHLYSEPWLLVSVFAS